VEDLGWVYFGCVAAFCVCLAVLKGGDGTLRLYGRWTGDSADGQREYAYYDSRLGKHRSIRAKALEEFERARASWCIHLRNTSNVLCNDELENCRTVQSSRIIHPRPS